MVQTGELLSADPHDAPIAAPHAVRMRQTFARNPNGYLSTLLGQSKDTSPFDVTSPESETSGPVRSMDDLRPQLRQVQRAQDERHESGRLDLRVPITAASHGNNPNDALNHMTVIGAEHLPQ